MTIKISLLITLLLMTTVDSAYAEQDFEIKNDLFYEQIQVPAKKLYQQKLAENGDVLLSLSITFNQDGYYDNFVFDDGDIKMAFGKYKNKQRQIMLSSQDTQSIISSQWISANSHYSTDGDMKINTHINDQGNVIYQKTFFDSEPEFAEIIHYYYLEDGEENPQTLIDNFKDGEQTSFITILERDQYGSWIKQREEKLDGIVEIHTRSIDYAMPK